MYNNMKIHGCGTIYTIVQNPDDNSVYKLTWESSRDLHKNETLYIYSEDEIRDYINQGAWKVVEEATKQSSLSTRKNGKVLMDLVETGFPHSMNALGELLTWAANNKGYLANDWKGLDSNEFLGAAARHRNWRLRGVERDHESNLYHLTHELFNVLAQLELRLIKDQA